MTNEEKLKQLSGVIEKSLDLALINAFEFAKNISDIKKLFVIQKQLRGEEINETTADIDDHLQDCIKVILVK